MKKVSIIVLNWNGKESLRHCLSSIQRVVYKPLEVIVVDNGSSDGSADMVRRKFPKTILLENQKNLGYAGGNNVGIRKSTGDYVFILNNDTEITNDFLEPLVNLMEKNSKIACVQPKLVYGADHSMLNAVGSFMTSTGFLYHYGYRKKENLAMYNERMKIFSAKGAAMLLRKSALDKVGVFDEDFFIFFEETDLCHRLWLLGYEVYYEPKSLIYHFEAVDTSRQMNDFTRNFLSFRNRICSFIKNFELNSIIGVFLLLIPIYLAMFFVYAIKLKFNLAWAVALSILWNFKQLPNTLKKRKKIQSARRVTDSQLSSLVKRNPPLIYYYYLFNSRIQNFTDETLS